MILNISLVNINIIYDISAHMYLYNYWERVQNTPVCHSIYDHFKRHIIFGNGWASSVSAWQYAFDCLCISKTSFWNKHPTSCVTQLPTSQREREPGCPTHAFPFRESPGWPGLLMARVTLLFPSVIQILMAYPF